MAFTFRSFAFSVAVALVFSGCGGGTGAAPPPTLGSSSVGQASLRFFIPSVAPAARHAKVLPSSTQSVQINVASSTTTPLASPIPATIINVVAGSGGCSSVSGGISCTATVTVPFGASLLFTIVAYAGQNATGVALAQGSATATIGTSTQGVSVTMSSADIYLGQSLEGGIGTITVDHGAGTFSVVSPTNPEVDGTLSTLPSNPDFIKLVVTTPTNGNSTQGDIVYARELSGSMMLFGDTGSTSVQAAGSSAATGGDMGAGVAAQGCPATGSSTTVTIADVPGPAWVATSPTYTSGTANITIASGTATVNFTGNEYDSGGSTGASQSGTQVCSGGIFSASNQGDVAFSPDGVTIVTNGSTGSVSPSDVKEGGFGFSETTTPSTTAALTGTYTGFVGGFTIVSGSVVKNETPVQVTPLSPSTLQGCLYSNFEAGTVDMTSCATINVGAATSQPGVYLATIDAGASTAPGAIVIGQTSSGKYAVFGTFGQTSGSGGQFIELIQH